MEDVTWKVLYEGISYMEYVMEDVTWEVLHEGDKMLYGRCYMEDASQKCYMQVLVRWKRL